MRARSLYSRDHFFLLPIRASCILSPTGVCNINRVAVEKKKLSSKASQRARRIFYLLGAGPISGRRDLTTGAQGPSNEIEGAFAAPLLTTALCRSDNRYGLPIHLRVAPVRTGHPGIPGTISSRGYCQICDTPK